jgi:hypothetical protein
MLASMSQPAPPYTAPSLAIMAVSVSRELRDPTNKTFSVMDVYDFINAALLEVGRIYPIQRVFDINPPDPPAVVPLTYAPGDSSGFPAFEQIFRVEIYRQNVNPLGGPAVINIPPNQSDQSSQGGWELFANTLYLPQSTVIDGKNDTIKVWGYVRRKTANPSTDTANEILDLDPEADYAVRDYACNEGYQRLVNVRDLFQQWINSPGNTDISVTQMMAIANGYEQKWQRTRKHLALLRR